MKKWHGILVFAATAAVFFACGDDDSSSATDQNTPPKEDAFNAEDFTLKQSFALKFDEIKGKPYFVRYTPSCQYKNKKFIVDIDSTTHVYLYEIKNDTLFWHNFTSKKDEIIKSSEANFFTGKKKEIFGTWEDNDCTIDYEDNEISCITSAVTSSIEFTKDSLIYIKQYPENFFTENSRNIDEDIVKLIDPNIDLFKFNKQEDLDQLYKENNVKFKERNGLKATVSINGKDFKFDFTGSVMKNDIGKLVKKVTYNDKSCTIHQTTATMPWKFCSDKYSDKLVIDGEKVHYVDNNKEEYNECLQKLLK